jgi:hypothetical protein
MCPLGPSHFLTPDILFHNRCSGGSTGSAATCVTWSTRSRICASRGGGLKVLLGARVRILRPGAPASRCRLLRDRASCPGGARHPGGDHGRTTHRADHRHRLGRDRPVAPAAGRPRTRGAGRRVALAVHRQGEDQCAVAGGETCRSCSGAPRSPWRCSSTTRTTPTRRR